MKTIEEYLEEIDLPFKYEIDGEETPLTAYDGVVVPLETGDQQFAEWQLHQYQPEEYRITLSQDTPGMVRELRLEEFETKLLTGEYTPAKRVETGYQKAEYR